MLYHSDPDYRRTVYLVTTPAGYFGGLWPALSERERSPWRAVRYGNRRDAARKARELPGGAVLAVPYAPRGAYPPGDYINP